MSVGLAAGKAALAAEVTTILGGLTDETVTVIDYEPRQIMDGRITATVSPGKIAPDYLTYLVRIYAPFPDAAAGAKRIEAAVELLNDQIGANWLDPDWEFGWDERLDLFAAQGAIATPRYLGA
jgi:hypothetical protein